jgi:hypothetical protein
MPKPMPKDTWQQQMRGTKRIQKESKSWQMRGIRHIPRNVPQSIVLGEKRIERDAGHMNLHTIKYTLIKDVQKTTDVRLANWATVDHGQPSNG